VAVLTTECGKVRCLTKRMGPDNNAPKIGHSVESTPICTSSARNSSEVVFQCRTVSTITALHQACACFLWYHGLVLRVQEGRKTSNALLGTGLALRLAVTFAYANPRAA
jgi:hypothetical protein